MAAPEDSDASLLSDLVQLKLEQASKKSALASRGDAEGAQELFRKALAAQQKQGGAVGDAQAAAAAEDGDGWEAWDEGSVPVAQQQQQAGAADGWEAAAEAAAAPPPPARSSRAAAPRAATAAAAAAAAAARPGGGGGDEGEAAAEPLQFGGGHVLELFDLTPAVRTQHLEAFLERHCSGHPALPTLKWVDDCHAAVVCADPKAARQLLAAATAAGPAAEFKLRGYADAGSGTRKLPGSELLPPRPRPATSAAVARRLIGGALNMRLRDRDAEQQLRQVRQTQRQEQEERRKALDSAWDD